MSYFERSDFLNRKVCFVTKNTIFQTDSSVKQIRLFVDLDELNFTLSVPIYDLTIPSLSLTSLKTITDRLKKVLFKLHRST